MLRRKGSSGLSPRSAEQPGGRAASCAHPLHSQPAHGAPTLRCTPRHTQDRRRGPADPAPVDFAAPATRCEPLGGQAYDTVPTQRNGATPAWQVEEPVYFVLERGPARIVHRGDCHATRDLTRLATTKQAHAALAQPEAAPCSAAGPNAGAHKPAASRGSVTGSARAPHGAVRLMGVGHRCRSAQHDARAASRRAAVRLMGHRDLRALQRIFLIPWSVQELRGGDCFSHRCSCRTREARKRRRSRLVTGVPAAMPEM
ncbi:DUF6233 domain-containing protein [Streptomyces fildesensis]|uniref:DUF6233 domain-containing protein n=1 Tax=Streptomyces fildesensis TaxID=375757 RepID=UPI0034D72A00